VCKTNPVRKIVINIQFNAKHDENVSTITYNRLLNENMPNGLHVLLIDELQNIQYASPT
jgi:hypothetical protein